MAVQHNLLGAGLATIYPTAESMLGILNGYPSMTPSPPQLTPQNANLKVLRIFCKSEATSLIGLIHYQPQTDQLSFAQTLNRMTRLIVDLLAVY